MNEFPRIHLKRRKENIFLQAILYFHNTINISQKITSDS